MNKSTQNLLLIGGALAALYYFMKNSTAGVPASNLPTISESDAQYNATAAAIANALPIGG